MDIYIHTHIYIYIYIYVYIFIPTQALTHIFLYLFIYVCNENSMLLFALNPSSISWQQKTQHFVHLQPPISMFLFAPNPSCLLPPRLPQVTVVKLRFGWQQKSQHFVHLHPPVSMFLFAHVVSKGWKQHFVKVSILPQPCQNTWPN